MAIDLLGPFILALLGQGDLVAVGEGHQELLKTIYTMQLANRTQFDRGEMDVTWRHEHPAEKEVNRVSAKLRWERDTTGIEYHVVREHPRLEASVDANYRMLIVGTVMHSYSEVGPGRYVIDSTQQKRVPMYVKLRPDEAWFGYMQYAPWSDLFDKPRFQVSTNEHHLVRKGDHAIYSRTDNLKKLRFNLVFDLSKSGNVVEMISGTAGDEDHFAIQKQLATGKCEWKQNAEGAWLLKRYFWKSNATPGDGASEFEILVENCVLGGNWSSEELTPQKFFRLSASTIVDERRPEGDRVYRLSDTRADLTERLNKLADKLKSQGFATSPKRE